MRRALLSVVVIGSALAAMDEDPVRLVFQDVRLQVGPAPASATAHLSQTGGGSSSGDITWDSTGRWAVQWVPSVAHAADDGAGFALVEVHGDRLVSAANSANERLIQRAVLADLHLGLAWIALPRTTLELTAFGGAGMTWQEGRSDRGAAWEVGARLGLTWAPWRSAWGRPLIGVAGLATYGTWRSSVELGSQTYDLDLRMAGVAPAAVIGWRF